MSAQGTQSPPLEATANPDPLGAVNIQGDKQKGENDFEQRKGVFAGEESGLKPGRQDNNSIDEAIPVAERSVQALSDRKPNK